MTLSTLEILGMVLKAIGNCCVRFGFRRRKKYMEIFFPPISRFLTTKYVISDPLAHVIKFSLEASLVSLVKIGPNKARAPIVLFELILKLL